LKKYKEYYRIYIDDIVITSNIIEEYFTYLYIIFKLFASKNIVLALKKLYFGYPNIELLGFCVDLLSFLIIKERIEVIRNLAFLVYAIGFLRYLIPYYVQFVELF
ncbi:hypothetical protein QBC45DRAFT_331153, partial [Copromyces sp. CBS 386.78]